MDEVVLEEARRMIALISLDLDLGGNETGDVERPESQCYCGVR